MIAIQPGKVSVNMSYKISHLIRTALEFSHSPFAFLLDDVAMFWGGTLPTGSKGNSPTTIPLSPSPSVVVVDFRKLGFVQGKQSTEAWSWQCILMVRRLYIQ